MSWATKDWCTGAMVGSSVACRSVALATVLAAVALTGCTTSHPADVGMMGGGGTAYHYSRLTCSAPRSLPGQTVNVTLADMGMTHMTGGPAPLGAHMMLRAMPATVPAGQISLVASNMGWRTHELVILPLAAGATAGQRVPGADGKVDETGSLGKASSSCAGGTGDGITAGTIGWTTVTLAPGRYELVCNLQNHYADGMHQQLVVT
jgi:uncharacterized cupredoxin-like copper-binding protein